MFILLRRVGSRVVTPATGHGITNQHGKPSPRCGAVVGRLSAPTVVRALRTEVHRATGAVVGVNRFGIPSAPYALASQATVLYLSL